MTPAKSRIVLYGAADPL